MEIPPYPETKRGLKFEAASKEMNLIVEEFFEIKNDNLVAFNDNSSVISGYESYYFLHEVFTILL